jgi:hypothetical protein
MELIMSAAVSIVFTGLCALVAGGNGRPAQVLLADARGIGQVGGVALPEHAPALVVSLGALANAETSGPSRVVTGSAKFGVPEQIGIWDLKGTEVRIKVQGREGEAVELFRPSRSSWPVPPRDLGDPVAWRDLRFVPDMTTLAGDGRIDPALVTTAEAAPMALPQRLAARIFLDGGRLEAGMPSQKIFRDRVFEFRGGGGEPKLRQALTDAVVWSVDPGPRTVVVEIAPLDGGAVKRLVLAGGGAPHELFVSNLPAENVPHALHHAVSEEEMAALHFGAYYELLMQPPADRPLPRLAPRHRKGVGLAGTAFCPPALFSAP